MAKPASDDQAVMPLTPASASTMPSAAIDTHKTFGIRRLATSTAEAVPPPAHRTASAIPSEVIGNGCPQHIADLVADQPDRRHREHRDQRGEQSVLEQVLAFVPLREPANRSNRQRNHGNHFGGLPSRRMGSMEPNARPHPSLACILSNRSRTPTQESRRRSR